MPQTEAEIICEVAPTDRKNAGHVRTAVTISHVVRRASSDVDDEDPGMAILVGSNGGACGEA